MINAYEDFVAIYGQPVGPQAQGFIRIIKYSGLILLSSLKSFDFFLIFLKNENDLSLSALVEKVSKIDYEQLQSLFWNQQFVKGLLRVVKNMAQDKKMMQATGMPGNVPGKLKAEVLKLVTFVLSVWKRALHNMPSLKSTLPSIGELQR